MASRSNVWDTMYGGGEENGAETSNQLNSQKMAVNNRRFLSAQPPFATDDETTTPPRNSRFPAKREYVFTTTKPLALAEKPINVVGGHVQRSREMFGGSLNEENITSPAKRKMPSSHDAAITRHLYPANPTTAFEQHTTQSGDYSGADLNSDLADIDDFAFRSDVQRCETLLGALSSNLEICEEKMSVEMVAKMAKELEKVVGVLDKEL